MSIRSAKTKIDDRTELKTPVNNSPVPVGFLNLVQDSQTVSGAENKPSSDEINELDGWARHSVARNGFGDF